MGTLNRLNTFFNWRSSVHNRTTARNTTQLVSAGRLRELRDRGWITGAFTPAEIAAVERILAAQMRAREEMAGATRDWPYLRPLLIGVVMGGIALAGFVASIRGGATGAVVFWVVALGAVAVSVTVMTRSAARYEQRRDEALARAVPVGCTYGWCRDDLGTHTLEGEYTPPRVFHAVEVERAVVGGRQ